MSVRLADPAADRRVAARLGALLDGRGVVLLHDRHLPGGSIGVQRVEAGRRGGTLRIGGWDGTALLDGVRWQAAVVRDALEAEGWDVFDVQAAICLPGASGVPSLGAMRVDGVWVEAPRPVAKIIARRGPLTPDQVDRVVDDLDRRFPPR